MILPVTLASAAAAAILNVWLMIRVGQVRNAHKIYVGDGGNEHVIRRMRAHSNFGESAPIVLVLIGAIELTGKGEPSLAYVAGAYIIARVLHAFGMENSKAGKLRLIGTIVTLMTLFGLASMAVVVLLGMI